MLSWIFIVMSFFFFWKKPITGTLFQRIFFPLASIKAKAPFVRKALPIRNNVIFHIFRHNPCFLPLGSATAVVSRQQRRDREAFRLNTVPNVRKCDTENQLERFHLIESFCLFMCQILWYLKDDRALHVFSCYSWALNLLLSPFFSQNVWSNTRL